MVSSPPNIILLTVDALRADHCSWHRDDRDTTPGLAEFAADNLCFTSAWSVSSHTREAIPGLLTGRYPDDCVDGGYALVADTIATLLNSTSYQRAGIHSNPFVSRAYRFDTDFNHFDDDLHFGQHKILALAQRALDRLRNRHYATAEQINERIVDWMESAEEPCFLWAHYMDPHGPYCPPDEYQQRYRDERVSVKHTQKMYNRAAASDPDSITPAERREMLNLYDGEITYTDYAISTLLDRLEGDSVLEDSLVILSADHGDGFGEHDYYGHPRHLHDCLTHVPLIVSPPNVVAETITGPATTLDIVPTILDAAGVNAGNLPGSSLLQAADDPGVFDDRIVYSQVRGMKDDSHLRRFRAISANNSCSVERDISSGDLINDPDGDNPLYETLCKHSSTRLGIQSAASSDESADPAVQRRLEALGYQE